MKRRLGVRHYLRYVDDLVLLSEDPAELERWHAAIETFLAQRLHLQLRADRARPRPVSSGVDFVGWRTSWSHRLPRRRTLRALRGRLGSFEKAAVRARPARDGRVRLRVDLRGWAGGVLAFGSGPSRVELEVPPGSVAAVERLAPSVPSGRLRLVLHPIAGGSDSRPSSGKFGSKRFP